MRLFIGDNGPIPVQFIAEDGTVINLTGHTVEWHFKKRDGSAPAGDPIIGTITTEASGEAEFILPVSLTALKIKYYTVMKILKASTLKKSTVNQILVDVDDIVLS